MALLPVLIAPDPRLKIKAEPVETVDDQVRSLMNDMLETMYANDGMGLAATQVDINKRIIVMDLNAGEENAPPAIVKLINPEILWTSEEKSTEFESCISVPGHYGAVERPKKIKVHYLDETNTQREVEADELFARCIQHEVDHLNGILYIDHLSRVKREIILRKLAKARKLRL